MATSAAQAASGLQRIEAARAELVRRGMDPEEVDEAIREIGRQEDQNLADRLSNRLSNAGVDQKAIDARIRRIFCGAWEGWVRSSHLPKTSSGAAYPFPPSSLPCGQRTAP